jgi:hypothetical protein
VDIGAELFAMSASCSRAMMLAQRGQKEAIALADTFCREAQLRIDEHFRNFYGPNDENMYKLAMSVLRGDHAWLEQGIASGDTEMGMAESEPVQPTLSDGYSEEVLAAAH